MDKNKSIYKLKGLPPIYYLNIDGQPERRQYMEDQFKYWEIENYTRISAYDGRDGNDLGDILKGRYPDMMSSGEVGCTTSHLKAIKYFLENTNDPCALIMEDDCDLSTVQYWPFTWKDFYAKVPYAFDVIQLAIISTTSVHVTLHRRFVNDFSTACYLITRHHAQKLVNLHIRGDKYKIDNGVKPRAVADDLIYNSGNTFAIPLFLYKIELGSSIHTDHIDTFHKNTHEGLWNFWKVDATSVEDWNQIFDYNPYYGTLPPGHQES
jgi:GR25 family glycosyltransferase involved in LPS biosynthesis